MDRYEIIMTPDAISDLTELRNYIVEVLHAPETARKYVCVIREGIATLDTMPARIAPVPDEPWHSRGIRKMIVKNFYVYFRIDSDSMRVYILNVIYTRRDQLKLLSEFIE